MDELSQRIEQLTKEVTQLERSLRLREAEEANELRQETDRVKTAEARLARAKAALQSEASALEVVEDKRTHLLARIDGWQGQLWRVGYGSAAMLTVSMVTTSVGLSFAWLGSGWAVAMLAGQGVLFGALYVLIPEKR